MEDKEILKRLSNALEMARLNLKIATVMKHYLEIEFQKMLIEEIEQTLEEFKEEFVIDEDLSNKIFGHVH